RGGTAQDAAFLKLALPVTGRRQKPRVNPYTPPEFYKSSEERDLLLQETTNLQDFEGWLWLKSRCGEAIRVRTRFPEIPRGTLFQEQVNRILQDARIGGRVSREVYLAEIKRRDENWIEPDVTDTTEQFAEDY